MRPWVSMRFSSCINIHTCSFPLSCPVASWFIDGTSLFARRSLNLWVDLLAEPPQQEVGSPSEVKGTVWTHKTRELAEKRLYDTVLTCGPVSRLALLTFRPPLMQLLRVQWIDMISRNRTEELHAGLRDGHWLPFPPPPPLPAAAASLCTRLLEK